MICDLIASSCESDLMTCDHLEMPSENGLT
jgi:hypothetical protein